MDKNSVIGIGLIAVILIGYTLWTKPSEEEIEAAKREAQRKRDSLAFVEQQRQQELEAQNDKTKIIDSIATDSVDTREISDSARVEQTKQQFGSFASATDGTPSFYTIENEKIKITFSSKGGRPYKAEIKDYKTHDSLPVILFDGEETVFGFAFSAENHNLQTNELFFTPIDSEKSVDASTSEKSIAFRLNAGDKDKYIEFEYTLKPNSYILDYRINFVGTKDVISSNTTYLDLHWKADIPALEKGREWENNNTSIFYKFYDDEVTKLTETKDSEEESVKTKLKWIAFKQQFFSTVLIADNYFDEAFLSFEAYDENQEMADKYLKKFDANITIPYSAKDTQIPLSFYFGPNKYSILRDVGKDQNLALEELIPLGWAIFRAVNKWAIIPLFNFLGSFIGNYGLLIFVLTIIIKLVLFPLTYKSYLSTAKMRVLKPQIEEINQKYPKEKAMERQQAVMGLYKKVGVNPMGGCFPMLLQFPILIAMFRFFPASIELRQKSFLWAKDLSTYDSVLDLPFDIPWYGDHVSLFCLLMAASMLLTTKINNTQMDTGTSQPGMKMMMYMMPVMMLFWFNNYSSGLSYYYFITQIITFGQTILIRRFVNDEEILQKLHSVKKKPVKKSGFQKRLEAAAKQRGYKPPKR